MNIFVAKLSYETSEAELREIFERFGEVTSAKIIFDKDTGRSKGFGFVEMENNEEAKDALQNLDNFLLKGRNIAVKEAIPKTENKREFKSYDRGGDRSGGYNSRNRY